MKQKLIAFAKYFHENSREINGLHGRFCLTSALKAYSWFYPLYLLGLGIFEGARAEGIEDPVAGRAGYLIRDKDFTHLL